MNDENKQNEGEFLFGGRLVPIKREGNIVYARPLRPGEKDTGETVKLQAGDRLVIPAEELVFNSREIDAYYNPKGFGGYAPVANTVWTWDQIKTERLDFFLFFFSLSRRADAAHTLWASAMQARGKAQEEGGIPRRQEAFNALATAEMAVIALHRCIRMVYELIEKFCPELEVPKSVEKICIPVQEIRHAFEHIDERAAGKVGPSAKNHPEALTIFNQPDFVESSILRYREHVLNFESEVITALLDCRELIMCAIDVRAARQWDEQDPVKSITY